MYIWQNGITILYVCFLLPFIYIYIFFQYFNLLVNFLVDWNETSVVKKKKNQYSKD